jgi:hypothetical protein
VKVPEHWGCSPRGKKSVTDARNHVAWRNHVPTALNCATTAIAELQHRCPRSVIFGGGYPSFPLKEMAVCRKVYRESIEKDLETGISGHEHRTFRGHLSAPRHGFGRSWIAFKSNNSINGLFGDDAEMQRRRL